MLLLRTFGGLWVESDDGSRRDGVRPRRLAILAMLAAAGPKGRTREQVLAVLWPESPPDKARAVLSQTLYNVGTDLGDEVIVATSSGLRLNPERLTSDLQEHRTALASQDWSRVSALYTGPFLDGFYLTDAPEFERWVEGERAFLQKEAARAIERVARAASEGGRVDEAVEQWERLTRIDPLSSAYAGGYMNSLSARGDRNGAIAHGQSHIEIVWDELETDPDPQVVALIARLRGGRTKVSANERDSLEPVAETLPAVSRAMNSTAAPPPPPLRAVRSRRTMLVAGVAAVGSLGLLGWRATALFAKRDTPVVAVGQVRDLVSPDSAQLGSVLSEMLATSIGRLTQLQVIANSRLLELIPHGAETTRAVRTDAAKRAGATQVLEGEVIPLSGSRLRFEVRRLDMQRGIVRAAYRIDGNDRMALFDSVAVLIASDLDVPPPTGTLAEVSTRSPLAYRLYEEGLRALTQLDVNSAHRLFSAAVREDSTFAMAMYYRFRSEAALNLPDQYVTRERALGLSSHASERDRLLIQADILAGASDPSAVAVAESLSTRYPNDPEGLVHSSDAIADLARATALLNRAIAIDSAAGAEDAVYCRLCEAFAKLGFRYLSADSLDLAESTARRWVSFRPKDSSPWGLLTEIELAAGDSSGAMAALRRSIAFGATAPDEGLRRLIWSLRTDDLDAANEECRTGLPRAAGPQLIDYRWLCTIALRNQGRFHDAMQLLRGDAAVPGHVAMLEIHLGAPASAAQRFMLATHATGTYPPQQSAGWQARNLTWNLSLAATAFAEAGDTVSVRRLVDSVEATGRRSLYVRDRLLHHFLRGLLLAKAAKQDSAAKEFRAAISSPSLGYTRINYELGRSLFALNHPAEAISVVRAPLHGGLDGPGLYLTRTETHELLARLFDAAGQRDSAVVHYAIVERAWRRADESLQPRHAIARARLAALRGQHTR